LSITIIACNSDNKGIEKNESTSVLAKNPLLKHTVLSDGHPLAVWEKKTENAKGIILFVHGRTWSGVPDFDLQVEGEDLSLMGGMVARIWNLCS